MLRLNSFVLGWSGVLVVVLPIAFWRETALTRASEKGNCCIFSFWILDGRFVRCVMLLRCDPYQKIRCPFELAVLNQEETQIQILLLFLLLLA